MSKSPTLANAAIKVSRNTASHFYFQDVAVNITEKVPALGTTGDVSLIDPSLYVIGDRMQLEIAASEHVDFLKNQMTWRFLDDQVGEKVRQTPLIVIIQ